MSLKLKKLGQVYEFEVEEVGTSSRKQSGSMAVTCPDMAHSRDLSLNLKCV